MNRSRLTRGALLLIPAVLGTIGFMLDRSCSFADAVFRCVTMYVLNYADTPQNILVELARWTAPIATASGVLLAFAALNQRFRNWLRYHSGDTVAVYGPEEDCERALEELGKRGVRGGETLVKAHRYLLLGSEESNLEFYGKYREELEKHMVFLRCTSLPVQAPLGSDVKLFSAEETAARLFWKRRCLYEKAAANGFCLNIVFLGFGKLGDELLYWGLQDNLFDPNQKLCYHIFGDCSAAFAIRRNLDSVGDPVIQHEEHWYENTDLLQKADIILVLEQREQTELLRDLHLTVPQAEITVFCARSAATDILAESFGMNVFDWQKEANTVANILEDSLYRLAKAINLRYCSIYSGVAETQENLESEWRKLDTFTRYSNISAADYHEIRLHMLDCMGIPPRFEALPKETTELLAELEHLRWCRYHFLMNWSYGIPESGARKDVEKRIHRDLVPYHSLTETDKEKDRENIRVLLSVQTDGVSGHGMRDAGHDLQSSK